MKTVAIDLENRKIQTEEILRIGDKLNFVLNGGSSAKVSIRSGSVTYLQSVPFSDELSITLDSDPLRRLYKYDSETGSRLFVLDVFQNGEKLFFDTIRIFNRRNHCDSSSGKNVSGMEDCPNDGNLYGRKFGQWIPLTAAITVNLEGTEAAVWYLNGESVGHASGETVTVDAGVHTIRFSTVKGMITPQEQTVNVNLGDASVITAKYESLMYYGYIHDGTTFSVNQITASMLSLNTVTENDTGPLTASINAPAGSVIFVLLPAESGLRAMKDDGLGGKSAFDLNNGTSGTGGNAIPMIFNDMEYLAYGEFNMVNAETIIYIGEE